MCYELIRNEMNKIDWFLLQCDIFRFIDGSLYTFTPSVAPKLKTLLELLLMLDS